MSPTYPRGRESTWRLHILGALLAVAYGVLLVMPFFMPTVIASALPNANEGDVFALALQRGGVALSAGYTAVFIGVMVIYGLAWQVSRRLAVTRQRTAIVFGWAIVFGLLLLLMQPAMTTDIYDYVVRGWQFAELGVSPLVTTPAATPGSPWLRLLAWPDLVSPYGPFWLAAEVAAFRLGAGDLLTTVVVLKGVGLVAYLIAAALVWRMLAVVAPAHRLSGTLLLAWNPLVVIEWIGNAHNDSVMVVLALASVWAVVTRRWWLVLPALGAAALVKAPAILLAPLILIFAVRQRDSATVRSLAIGGVVAVALAIAGYGWAWQGPNTLLHIVRASGGVTFVNSLGFVALRGGQRFLSLDPAVSVPVIRLAATAAFLACYALIAVHVRRQPGTLILGWHDATAFLLVAGAVWFWPWYVTWALGPAALLTDRRRQIATMTLSATALLRYVANEWSLPFAPYMGSALVILALIAIPAALFARAWWPGRCADARLEPQPAGANDSGADAGPTAGPAMLRTGADVWR
ncbi:MAG: hypothetical protein IT340_15540 [Chloroflexi bacterium]|nr:hypothetical protein [Chloroflexota bacterium]